jgi:hypothetical protein
MSFFNPNSIMPLQYCPYKVTSHYELNQNIHSPVFTHQKIKINKNQDSLAQPQPNSSSTLKK